MRRRARGGAYCVQEEQLVWLRLAARVLEGLLRVSDRVQQGLVALRGARRAQEGLELLEEAWLGPGGGPFLCGAGCSLADLVAVCELEGLGGRWAAWV